MDTTYCSKCNETNKFFIEEGTHYSLKCGKCGSWIKFVSVKDLPFLIDIKGYKVVHPKKQKHKKSENNIVDKNDNSKTIFEKTLDLLGISIGQPFNIKGESSSFCVTIGGKIKYYDSSEESDYNLIDLIINPTFIE